MDSWQNEPYDDDPDQWQQICPVCGGNPADDWDGQRCRAALRIRSDDNPDQWAKTVLDPSVIRWYRTPARNIDMAIARAEQDNPGFGVATCRDTGHRARGEGPNSGWRIWRVELWKTVTP